MSMFRRLAAPDADRLVLAAAFVLLVHGAVALGLGLGAYADGAWFDFALAVGRPFALVWRNYPERLTHYLFEYLPAYGLLRLNASPAAALLLAHTLWFFAPLGSLLLCRSLIPAERRALALAPAAYFVLAALLTWGFPTETWLMAAFAWPAFFALAYGRGRVAAVLAAIMTVAVPLSYEAGLLVLPLLVWAGLGRADHRAGPMRAAILVATGLALAALAAAALDLKPSPQIAADLKSNGSAFFSLIWIVWDPAVRKEVAICVLAVGAGLTARFAPRLRGPVMALLLLAGVVVVLGDAGKGVEARYRARTLCLLLLLTAMAATLWLRRRPHWRLSGVPSEFVLAAAVLMTAAMTAENMRFALAWRDYERAVAETTACRENDSGCSPGAVVSLAPSQADGPAGWPWGLPFRSILAAPDLPKARLLRDAPGAHMPLSCDDAKAVAWAGTRPPALLALTRLACAPENAPS